VAILVLEITTELTFSEFVELMFDCVAETCATSSLFELEAVMNF